LSDTKLRGLHNIENLMATLAAGMARGLSFREMMPPLCTYEPRPHRCEFVREVGGVAYLNDSKATNLDAVEKALRAQTKPVILIAGGKDKGFTFDPLRPLIEEKVKSTCSKATPIAAINFAPLCRLCRSRNDENATAPQTQKASGRNRAALRRRICRNGLRRDIRAKHETVSSIADRFASSRGCCFRNHRI
jgi:UDP-N-acetylmuramoylalanine-D-glutamate ligase